MKQTLLKYFARILGRFPSKLPASGSQFKTFADSILWTYDLPNNMSYHGAIAKMVMHLGPTTHRKPKYYFAQSVMKAQANEVAYGMIQAIKNEMEREDRERAVKQQEETAQKVGSPIDGDKQPQSGVQAASA